jgi:glycerophosphoryl diester phosphodiesterase
VRAYFLLNVAIVEDRRLSGGVRRSGDLTVRRRWTIAAVIVCWWGFTAVVAALIMVLYRMFAGWYVDRLGAGLYNAVIGIVLVGGLLMVILLVLTFLFNATESLMSLDLYHQSIDEQPSESRWMDVRDQALSGRLLHGITPHVFGALIVVAAATVLLASPLTGRSEPGPKEKVVIAAHRGASMGAPENTLAAIQKAIDMGADMAEIDVQLTYDNAVVVIHDFDLMRIAGIPKRVSQMTLEEIRNVDAGSWFSPDFRDERIPTLGEVLDLAKGKIRLNIELKYTKPNPQLARRVVRAIKERGADDWCVISSLDHQGLMDVRQAAPDLPIGFIVGESVGAIEKLDVDFLSVSSRLLNRDLMNRARRQGKYVHVWTVNDPAGVERSLDMGVAGILTDDPPMVAEVVDERSRLSDAEQVIAMFRRWLRS